MYVTGVPLPCAEPSTAIAVIVGVPAPDGRRSWKLNVPPVTTACAPAYAPLASDVIVPSVVASVSSIPSATPVAVPETVSTVYPSADTLLSGVNATAPTPPGRISRPLTTQS